MIPKLIMIILLLYGAKQRLFDIKVLTKIEQIVGSKPY